MNISFTDFIILSNNLIQIQHKLNNIILKNNLFNCIINWNRNTHNERYKSSIQMILTLYESLDIDNNGYLNYLQLNSLIIQFYIKMNLEYNHHKSLLKEDTIKYTFIDTITILHNLDNLSISIYNILDDFLNKKITICRHCHKLLYLTSWKTDKYTVCNYSYSKTTNQVLYCSSGKNKYHPNGLYIDINNVDLYFNDLLTRRLETNIYNQIRILQNGNNKTKLEELQDKYRIICRKLLPQTIIYYSSLKVDLYYKKNPQLLQQNIIYQGILKHNNYNQIITSSINNFNISIEKMNSFIDTLDIKKNIFSNKISKKFQIIILRLQYKELYNTIDTNIKHLETLNELFIDIKMKQDTLNMDIMIEFYTIIDKTLSKYYESIGTLQLSTPLDTLITYIKKNTMETNSICNICLEDDTINNDIIVLDSCQHYFHNDCILKWLLVHNKCPICK